VKAVLQSRWDWQGLATIIKTPCVPLITAKNLSPKNPLAIPQIGGTVLPLTPCGVLFFDNGDGGLVPSGKKLKPPAVLFWSIRTEG
jgi:hypothetical protein